MSLMDHSDGKRLEIDAISQNRLNIIKIMNFEINIKKIF